MAANLVRERAPDAADRIHIFDFDLLPESDLLFGSDRYVAVATELTFLHVGVAHPSVNQNLLERSEKRERFLRRIDFRLRHNLHQWRPGAVKIDT